MLNSHKGNIIQSLFWCMHLDKNCLGFPCLNGVLEDRSDMSCSSNDRHSEAVTKMSASNCTALTVAVTMVQERKISALCL